MGDSNYADIHDNTDVSFTASLRHRDVTRRLVLRASERLRIRIRWSCCDFVHHEHRWCWTARLCGMVQRMKLEGASNQFWWTVGFATLLTCLLLFGK